MESASQHSPKRLLRLAIAGGILATAWFVVDAITHSEPAAAAETIDLVPLGDGSPGGAVTGILETATTLVTPVTSTLTPVVTAVAAPVTTQVVTPVSSAVTPLLAPVVATVDGVANPVLAPVLASVGQVVAPVTTAVIAPLSPVLEATLGQVTLVDTIVEATQGVPALRPNGTVLAAGGAVILGVVLGALATPLLPAPSNGGPLNAPLAPAAPSGSNGSSSVALYGELSSGVPAGTGAFGTVGASVDDLPSSPTFASDTTPD